MVEKKARKVRGEEQEGESEGGKASAREAKWVGRKQEREESGDNKRKKAKEGVKKFAKRANALLKTRKMKLKKGACGRRSFKPISR